MDGDGSQAEKQVLILVPLVLAATGNHNIQNADDGQASSQWRLNFLPTFCSLPTHHMVA